MNCRIEILPKKYSKGVLLYLFITSFNFLKDPILVKEMNISIRQQQMLKTRAIVNLGNESGMNLWTARYSTSYILNNKYFGPIHGAQLDGKKRERPFKSGNYVTGCVYL